MRGVLLLIAIILSLIAGLFIWARISSRQAVKETLPYVTYTRLIYLAEGCDKYRTQFGKWPSSLPQLQIGRPELVDPWDKDAWGRELILVPYNGTLGYGEIISYGRDGKPGGTGDDRELEVRFPTDANANWNKHEGTGLKEPRLNP